MNRKSQQGMVTLLFTVVLMITLTILSFTTAKTLLTEQTISANELRGKEVGYAAEAALEYGIGWFNSNFSTVVWSAANTTTATPTTITAGSDSYTLSVQYERNCLSGACDLYLVEVTATAVANNDSDLTRTQVIRLLEDRNNNLYIRVPGSWRDW
ncbi:hypothetical protein SAMN02745127_02483 [Oceanospirillum multiglobuliferum]|uniref:Type 4 fimbrial biogenesis protein PilX N-terminal domain-containing protein n=1 Tax=Oceanospirillum multiglobuliferum TaxID=64969 RepID=A0A1T4RMP8_9GAMM|nr:hypothetical protein [Oceanospirillum multiglobuliferum]OPX54772.1 hypothetical protein BTE48_12775 [Oceanospirillum multiglobuliferum]SKA17270.1 hypothetical protein SAMN02745127_02483 [Oceanospirillum multiglobuliferum]